MVALDEFSRVVSEIHASSICPDNWPMALAEVRRVLEAEGCAILVGRGTDRSLMCGALEAEARKRYVEHYYAVDYVLDAVENGPIGVVRGGRELVALQHNSEFEADFMRPYAMDDGVFVRLSVGEVDASFLAAAPKRSEPFDTAERVALVAALVRHLRQALCAGVHFAELRYAAGQFDDIVDTFKHGVVIVDAAGRIVRTNAVADRILASVDGLALRAAVCVGNSVTCRRSSGKRPYILHVAPLTQSDGALVMIVDPESDDEPHQDVLRRTFGMTGAEAEVARRVMRGDGLNQIADELSVWKATVRTHLQHIFDKTDTHRQAELLRLLMTVSPPVRR